MEVGDGKFRMKLWLNEKDIKPTEVAADYFKAFVAEFLGMFFFMFSGCACTHVSAFSPFDYFFAIVGFSFVISSMVQVTGPITGGHLNPAVTVAVFLLGHNSILKTVVICLGQIIGAIIGMATLKCLSVYVVESDSTWCVTEPSHTNVIFDLTLEFLATTFLLFAVLSIIDTHNKYGNDSNSVKIAFLLVAVIYPIAPYTGCSMNPARSLAPAIVHNVWNDHWIYWVGPFAASVTTSMWYQFLFMKPPTQDHQIIPRKSYVKERESKSKSPEDDA